MHGSLDRSGRSIVVAGEDFRFGRGGAATWLCSAGMGFEVRARTDRRGRIVEPDPGACSQRERSGRPPRLLGRPAEVEGLVVGGDQRGGHARVSDREPRRAAESAGSRVRDLRRGGRRYDGATAPDRALDRRQPPLRRLRAPHRSVPARLRRRPLRSRACASSCGSASATSGSSRASGARRSDRPRRRSRPAGPSGRDKVGRPMRSPTSPTSSRCGFGRSHFLWQAGSAHARRRGVRGQRVHPARGRRRADRGARRDRRRRRAAPGALHRPLRPGDASERGRQRARRAGRHARVLRRPCRTAQRPSRPSRTRPCSWSAAAGRGVRDLAVGVLLPRRRGARAGRQGRSARRDGRGSRAAAGQREHAVQRGLLRGAGGRARAGDRATSSGRSSSTRAWPRTVRTDSDLDVAAGRQPFRRDPHAFG